MDLLVIRHAAAEERDSSRWPDDSRRPLADAGRKKFRRVARLLGKVAEEKPVILASRWVRAWDTAEILAQEARWTDPVACPALEDQPASAALAALRSRMSEPSVALVGHEPQLSRLISLLLTGRDDGLEIEMRKGAVACLSLDAAEPGAAQLCWLLPARFAKR